MSRFLQQLSAEERRQLERYQFDRETFERLRERFVTGGWTTAQNRVEGAVEMPHDGDILTLPPVGSDERERLEELGRGALEAGEVGALVLNGGMATRFGSVVKGCVEVFEGVSFLGIKLADAARWNAPVLLMNSFATDDKTDEHLEEFGHFGFSRNRLLTFSQSVSLRLTPEGEIFGLGTGETLYAPGHGDVAQSVRRHALDRFRAMGGKYLLMSNVDNVLASLDPAVIGFHIDQAARDGVQVTIEAVDNQGSTTGGMPARVDGKLQVVEAFRFPHHFDPSSIPVYNTNTFLFSADALDRTFDLTWFVVEKEVNGEKAVQFERLAGELSAFLNTQFLQVPRAGRHSRFLPIKRREDLRNSRGFLKTAVDWL